MGSMAFVNRNDELRTLGAWWEAGGRLALLWGRRRVGKTWLLSEVATRLGGVVHVGAGRPAAAELRLAGDALASAGLVGRRDVDRRPFVDWDDLLDTVETAVQRPVLLGLDEFPDLLQQAPDLPGVLRAHLERHPDALVRLVICGSATRTMRSMEEERAPLYGRIDLSLQIHPFAPHEAALLLPGMDPTELALVYGLLGGMPPYLSWWDGDASVEANLARLVTDPGGRLLTEGELVLATETDAGDLTAGVLRAVATGATKHNEVADRVRADPTRTLERLVDLRLLERLSPVTDDQRKTRRRLYRVADNFLAFYLGVLDRHRTELERGLGPTILPVVMASLDDALGRPWEEMFRTHLRRLATAGALGPEVVAIGPWWRDGEHEIDAVVLAGRDRHASLVGEAKWAMSVSAPALEANLRQKAMQLPVLEGPPRLAVAARAEVRDAAADTLVVTAADVFGAV